MSHAEATAALAHLQHRRRELRKELARVRWWRRLVRARMDLSIASLARAEEAEAMCLSQAWEALAANAPTSVELAQAVWTEPRGGEPASVEALTRLDARLESYERRVSDDVETVTAHMVKAWGEEQRSQMSVTGGERG